MALTGGLALGGVGITASTGRTDAVEADRTFTVMEGTDHETTGYVQTGATDGPTVLVVGGIHGDEVAGYLAAEDVAEMDIDRGRLVTVPRVNAVAVADDTRTGEDGVDLNRQFPVGAEPTTELARALWGVVTRFEPDVVIDLQESIGIYDGDITDGVGQAIFHSQDASARAEAAAAADYLNENYVADPTFDFQTGPFAVDEIPTDLFVHKVARDTGATAFLAETTVAGHEISTRVEWHVQLVRRLVRDDLLDEGDANDGTADDSAGDESAQDEEEQAETDPNESPEAVIRTDPPDAAEVPLSKGDTVTLDGSASTDPDGEIASYAWTVDGLDDYDEDAAEIELTLSACGTFPVALQVTDDDGATATAQVALSTE